MTSWLPDQAPGATPMDRVFGLRPELYEAFRAFYALFWTGDRLDPVVAELCRLRVAQLLGCASEQEIRYRAARDCGLTEEQVRALPGWPDAAGYTDAQRAAIGFAEQFVLDPHGITPQQRDQVIDHLGIPGLVALCELLALYDGFDRFRTILGVEAAATSTVVATPGREASLR